MTRTYLVTGSASGIGAAAAAHLRNQGAHVVGADLRDSDITVDLATADGRRELVEQAHQLTGGRLDGVVACAGVALFGPITIGVNYFGAVATLEGLRPLLVEGTDPRAVVISSVASLHPTDSSIVEAALAGDEAAATAAARSAVESGHGAQIYSSSKAAIARWVRRNAVTAEWAGMDIPLNAIAPGTIITPTIQAMLDTDAGRKAIDGSVPMPLNGHAQPQQVAQLISWLVSKENSHITGQVVFLDGGADAVLRGDGTW